MNYGNNIYPTGKIVNKDLKILESHSDNNIDDRVYIDIIPFDNVPDDLKKSKTIYRKTSLYKRLICYKYIDMKYLKTRRKNKLQGFIEVVGYHVFAKHLNGDKLVKKTNSLVVNKYNSSKYAGSTVWGYGIRERVLKSDFEIQDVEFEGQTFNGIKGYDDYLSSVYGKNYMELPPEEKRINHNIKFINIMEM